jgi:hypothetical protein
MPEPTPAPPLRRADLTFLQHSLARQQCRRRAYRPGPLRVDAGGHERGRGAPASRPTDVTDVAAMCDPLRGPIRAGQNDRSTSA